MKKQNKESLKLKTRLQAAQTPEEITEIARSVGTMTELSLNDLDQISGGAGGHTHVWHYDPVKFSGLLRSRYCTCGTRSYFVSGKEVPEDIYYDFYARLKGLMPNMEFEGN